MVFVNGIGWGIDLKLLGVQAWLTRAGTSLLVVCSMCLVLVASDTASHAQSPAQAEVVPDDYDSVYVLPFTNHRGVHRVTEGRIPVGRAKISVPILMYHYIQNVPRYADRLTFNLSVAPSDFSKQMDWLDVHSYHPITFDDLRAYFGGQRALPSKPVVITFDDGYRDLYTTAYPILKLHKFKAVAYIVSSFVGRSRYVTGPMLLEMDHYGIQIGSHTVDHGNLARMSLPSINYEIKASKQWLEALVGHPVVDFCYPSGQFNALVVSALGSAGYSTATTEAYSTFHMWADRYAWPRVRVGGGESLADFIRYLGYIEPFVVTTTTVT
jgi:peptidoglycan/xylan/chitin deacetylase (PgdA/CDA1 family)